MREIRLLSTGGMILTRKERITSEEYLAWERVWAESRETTKEPPLSWQDGNEERFGFHRPHCFYASLLQGICPHFTTKEKHRKCSDNNLHPDRRLK